MPRKKQEAPKATCVSCIYWCQLDEPGRQFESGAGECRRYPMVFIPANESESETWANPPAPADHWCGEHAVKPNS